MKMKQEFGGGREVLCNVGVSTKHINICKQRFKEKVSRTQADLYQ